ncbi:hypothetical protein AAF712_016907, partial [Marasmius tenuissimus]
KWLNGLEDVEKVQQWFFQSCKDAGPQSCAFYEDSTEAMNSKLQGIYARLNENPIPVCSNLSYGVVDYGALHPVILLAWYSPFTLWHPLAAGLQALAEGDASVLWSVFDAPPFE